MDLTFFGGIDLAAVALWLFYLFFAGLVIWLQRENMREGYPMEDETGAESANQGPYPIPYDKTFKLPHGRGEVTVPSGQRGDRDDLALAPADRVGDFRPPAVCIGRQQPCRDQIGEIDQVRPTLELVF